MPSEPFARVEEIDSHEHRLVLNTGFVVETFYNMKDEAEGVAKAISAASDSRVRSAVQAVEAERDRLSRQVKEWERDFDTCAKERDTLRAEVEELKKERDGMGRKLERAEFLSRDLYHDEYAGAEDTFIKDFENLWTRKVLEEPK